MSISLTVIGKVPDSVGVPVISPVFKLKLRPSGSVPAMIGQAPSVGSTALPTVLVCAIGVIALLISSPGRAPVVMIGLATTLMVSVSSSNKSFTSVTF